MTSRVLRRWIFVTTIVVMIQGAAWFVSWLAYDVITIEERR